MTDIVQRLRRHRIVTYAYEASTAQDGYTADADCREAADEIERLRVALARLRRVLTERHHGRMPAEVQEAYDAAGVALEGSP